MSEFRMNPPEGTESAAPTNDVTVDSISSKSGRGSGSRTTTMLFTDLVGSTAQRQLIGDDAAENVRRMHFRILRDAVAARGGREVKNVGDGLMVAFENTVDAIGCAISMQQAVRRHNIQDSQPGKELSVRVGMHVGEPIEAEQDYFGAVVDVAARLCACAEGGQIIVSGLVRQLVGSRGGYSFRDLGPLKLKGIVEPLAAFEVRSEVTNEPVQPPRVDDEAVRVTFPGALAGRDRTTFVARSDELERLRQRWERVLAGDLALVLLAGQPGIGKTRLAAEFAKSAYERGANVLYGRCEEQPFGVYQPIAEILQQCNLEVPDELSRPSSATAGIAAQASRPPQPDADPNRYSLFQVMSSLVSRLVSSAPLVIIFDDLHWADRETLHLVHHLLRALATEPGCPVLILGTYRVAEIPRTHPLAELISDSHRDRILERITVGGLDESGVGQLIDAWGGSEAPRALVQAVYDQTEGNPFFIEEVLLHLEEAGTIDPSAEKWVDNPDVIETLRLPETVKDVIRRRLARLSSDCNSLLTVASVIGQEFGIDALERASDLAADRLLELLESAIEAKVISESPRLVGRFGFSHGLIYETLHDELTSTRRVHLHGQTLMYAASLGANLAYEVLGATGPYAVAVGISNCPAVRTRYWNSTRHWDRAGRRCRVILYDRRGVGFSSAPERGYSPLAAVEDLRALLDANHVNRVVLWGATDGGPLALLFAAHHPERVAALLLLATTAKYVSAEDFRFGVNPAVLDSFFQLDPLDPRRAVSELVSTARPGARAGADEIAEVLGRVPPRVWPKVVGGVGALDARGVLSRITCPTLIVHDAKNDYIPVGAAHYMHEHIAESRLHITDEISKLPWGESVYDIVEAFVEEATGGPV